MVGEKSVLPGCVAACHVDRRFFSPSFFFLSFFLFSFFRQDKEEENNGLCRKIRDEIRSVD